MEFRLNPEPPSLLQRLPGGLAILAAGLGGLGLICYIAANWDTLGRFGRFALLQAAFLAFCAGAGMRPAARVPLSLAAFIACGGLFAYFGQTYQTGADPWQLFALWAGLMLPFVFAIRHDALWLAWSAVTLTAFALLASTLQGGFWRDGPSLFASLGSWVPALALAWLLSPAFARWTGAGSWPTRLCMVYAVTGLAFSSLISLFGEGAPLFYLVGLAALGAMGWAFSRRERFDVFVLSALGLAVNVLVASLLVRLMVVGQSESVFALLVIALVSTGMLAWTVKAIMRLSQQHTEGAQA